MMINENKTEENDKILPSEPPSDELGIRCPRLGHQINFSYCRGENNGLPCFKTLDCWFHHFDVHSYLKKKLTRTDFQKTFIEKGTPKVFSLLDLIEKAREKKKKSQG